MFGWVGNILRVDLTTGKISREPTSRYVPRLIGGWGIAAKIAWEELPPTVGAFDPENRLIIMTGPLTGTLIPGSGRVEISTISPITYSFDGPTEDYIRSGIGGQWGPELKFAGYDGLVIQGIARDAVWIYIEDETVEIRDGRNLSGLDTYATQEAIWKDVGRKTKVLCIGPAGEKRLRFATIATDNGNHSGVGGTGAVMGSKNLKAIAVRGTGGIEVASPEQVYELAYQMHRFRLRSEARPPFGIYGLGQHRLGGAGEVKDAEIVQHIKRDTIKGIACWGCPIACRPVFFVPGGLRPGISNFCSGMSRFRSPSRKFYGGLTRHYLKIIGEIDGAGMNCHEVHSILDWLRGCYEEGTLSEKETGISLKDYGSYDLVATLIRKLCQREGFADLLAEGALRASDAIGGIGKQWIPNINRGFHEVYYPQILPTSAFAAAFESSVKLPLFHTWATRFLYKHEEEPAGRGWLTNDEWVQRVREIFGERNVIDHSSEEAYYHPDKAFLAKWTEDYKTMGAGCLILCDWVIGQFWSWYSDEALRREPTMELESKAYSVVTGAPMDPEQYLRAGERVRNLERAIMVREGRRRKDDTLADYCFQDAGMATQVTSRPVPGPDGHWVTAKRSLDRKKWESLKDRYYELRGWDPATGIPTRARLEALDLKDVAEDMEKQGIL